MELEFFCEPGEDLKWFDYWKAFCVEWLAGLGIKGENVRTHDYGKEELSHYSKATTDIEYFFQFGWGELRGIADRTNFDLKQHSEHSSEDLSYIDQPANKRSRTALSRRWARIAQRWRFCARRTMRTPRRMKRQRGNPCRIEAAPCVGPQNKIGAYGKYAAN
jgi:glycyl-tRNA synthetase (class II)